MMRESSVGEVIKQTDPQFNKVVNEFSAWKVSSDTVNFVKGSKLFFSSMWVPQTICYMYQWSQSKIEFSFEGGLEKCQNMEYWLWTPCSSTQSISTSNTLAKERVSCYPVAEHFWKTLMAHGQCNFPWEWWAYSSFSTWWNQSTIKHIKESFSGIGTCLNEKKYVT